MADNSSWSLLNRAALVSRYYDLVSSAFIIETLSSSPTTRKEKETLIRILDNRLIWHDLDPKAYHKDKE